MNMDNATKLALIQKRVDAKDPVAINFLGDKYFHGRYGLEKNVPRGIELLTEAAELGCIDAFFSLGIKCFNGEGVPQDKAKSARYYELAAMQGHVEARHNLGNREFYRGNYERAVRHYLISAKMGDKQSLEVIKDLFVAGHATKEQYAEALKGNQIATEEMMSPERDEVESVKESGGW